MLTNFFGNTKPVNSVLIIALFLSYLFISYFFGSIVQINFTLFFLFIIQFAVVNFINSRNELTFDNSYFFLFFITLIGFFPKSIIINTSFYTNLTLLLFLRKVYSLQSSKTILKKLFDGGFWIGISFILEPFSVIFIILIYASVLYHQRLSYQTLFAPVFGFITPIILYFTYCFWFDKSQHFHLLFNWYTSYDFQFYNTLGYCISFGIVGVLLFFSWLYKSSKALNIKNTFRKNWILISIHFLLSVLLFLVVKIKNGSELLYLFFPTAIIIANGFELIQKKWYADIVLIVILCSSFITFFW